MVVSETGLTGGGGVLLTGASGLVGSAIREALGALGTRVLMATRAGSAPGRGVEGVEWDPYAPHPFPDLARIEGLDAVIHLSGASLVGQRWTAAYKEEIVQSRTVTTTALSASLARLSRPPRIFISASATGIYGDRGDETLTESSSPGTGFLSETCQAWEASTQAAEEAGLRVVHLRLGVVITPKGGALAKVLPLARLGLGGRLGSGRQWMSWAALEDVVGAVLHLAGLDENARSQERAEIRSTLRGAVNCVAPNPVTNAEYTRALGRVLHRPALAVAPAFALRLAMGEMADETLLAGCRALPEKLLADGYRFRYPEMEPALEAMLGR